MSSFDTTAAIALQLVWLGFAWGAVLTISRIHMSLPFQLAAWVAAAMAYVLARGAIFSVPWMPDSILLLFLIAGVIASRGLAGPIESELTSGARATAVVAAGLAFMALLALSAKTWAFGGGGWTAKAGMAAGLVGIMSLPSSAFRRVFE